MYYYQYEVVVSDVSRRRRVEASKTRFACVFMPKFSTLDDLREAVTTLEDAERIARRVFGDAYLLTGGIERELQQARAALCARKEGKILEFVKY